MARRKSFILRPVIMRIMMTAVGFAVLASAAAHAQGEPKGAAVTVLTATKSCFTDRVSAAGILMPRGEISIRPDRPGQRVTEVLVEPGNTVTANQPLARLAGDGNATTTVSAPVAGLISASTAIVGAIASGSGDALFKLVPRNEFDLIAQIPTRDLPRVAANQRAQVFVVGAGEVAGTVKSVSPVIEPNVQLGQITVSLTGTHRLMINGYARASITVGESCGVALPLTSVLYSDGGTVVQVVRRNRVETRQIETGLMQGDRVEVRQGLSEGDVVVARAGSVLREGDVVQPVSPPQE